MSLCQGWALPSYAEFLENRERTYLTDPEGKMVRKLYAVRRKLLGPERHPRKLIFVKRIPKYCSNSKNQVAECGCQAISQAGVWMRQLGKASESGSVGVRGAGREQSGRTDSYAPGEL